MWLEIVLLLIAAYYLLVRRFVSQHRRGHHLLEPVRAADAIWLLADPSTNNMFITALLIVDKASVELARKVVQERGINAYPRLSDRVVYANGKPYFDPMPNMNVEDHVVRADVDNIGEKELQDYLSNIWNVTLPADKPLWQYQIVENYKDGTEAKSAVIFRIHHTYADGLALVSHCLSLMDDGVETLLTKATSPKGGAPRVGVKRTGAIQTVIASLRFPLDLLHKFFVVKPDDNPIHGLPLSGVREVSWSDRIPLDKIKALGKAQQYSVNDVLMSALAGALRQVYIDKGVKAMKDMKMNVPISVRLSNGGMPVQGVLDNHVSIVWADLPVACDDRKERMKRTQASMAAIKSSQEPLGNYLVLQSLCALTPARVSRFCFDWLGDKTTAVLTNVPGPISDIYFDKHKVHDMIFWVPAMASIGVGLGIISYAGNVRIGVSIDKVFGLSPASLAMAFNKEFQAMCDDFL